MRGAWQFGQYMGSSRPYRPTSPIVWNGSARSMPRTVTPQFVRSAAACGRGGLGSYRRGKARYQMMIVKGILLGIAARVAVTVSAQTAQEWRATLNEKRAMPPRVSQELEGQLVSRRMFCPRLPADGPIPGGVFHWLRMVAVTWSYQSREQERHTSKCQPAMGHV
jgi:hypothetical protein